MEQVGSRSMTFAKAFSDSSYSNECNSSMARLKSAFTFSLQDILNSTDPNCLSGGPQEMIAPLFNFNWSMSSFDGPEFFPWQAARRDAEKINDNIVRDDFLIL